MRLHAFAFSFLALATLILFSHQPATAQDKPEATETKQEDETGKQPADDTSATKPADASPAARFAQALENWKQSIKELRELAARYNKAPAEEADALRQQWNAAIAKADTMIPPLREAAKDAYVAAPNEDRQLTRFLGKLLDDSLKRDQYEVVADLAKVLIDNNSGVKEAYDAAGIAAFALNDYDNAGKYFAEAKRLSALSETGKKYIGEVENYKKLWAEEEEIRKKEAEAGDLPKVRIQTNKGDIVAELFENEAPETVGNFVSLTEKGFYDGLTFHRVLPGFMAQGGCPKGDGTGGPGYQIYDEHAKPNHRNHFRGSLSMAHSQLPNSGGSQFFITFIPTPHLNGQHTVFGRVVEGMDVLERLQRIDPMAKGDKPTPDRMEKVEVLSKRNHEYVPNKVQ